MHDNISERFASVCSPSPPHYSFRIHVFTYSSSRIQTFEYSYFAGLASIYAAISIKLYVEHVDKLRIRHVSLAEA